MTEGYADTTPWCSVHRPDSGFSRCLDCGASLWFGVFAENTGTPLVVVVNQGTPPKEEK